MNGCLIAFEGIEGSGKTEQAKLLKRWLQKQLYYVVYAKEPTNYYIGRLISRILERKIEVAEEAIPLLFAADRADHTMRCIVPALNQGSVILADRYVHSSLAYQGKGMSIPFDNKWLNEINKYAVEPNIVFFLDVPAEEGLSRIKKYVRISDDKYFEDLETQKRIRQAYHDIFDLYHPVSNIEEFANTIPAETLSSVLISKVNQTLIIKIDGTLSIDKIHRTIRLFVHWVLKTRKVPKKNSNKKHSNCLAQYFNSEESKNAFTN
jgi:dTMP kinase